MKSHIVHNHTAYLPRVAAVLTMWFCPTETISFIECTQIGSESSSNWDDLESVLTLRPENTDYHKEKIEIVSPTKALGRPETAYVREK